MAVSFRQRLWVLAISCLTPALGMQAAAQFEVRGQFLAESDSSPFSVSVGDFNHDGNLDLAVASGCCPGGGVTILLGRGDGTFVSGVYYATGDQPFSVVAADFNHDGNPDLAVANSLSPYLTILLGNGDGTFRASAQNPALAQPAIFVVESDFNGDGIPDLATVGSNIISVFLGNGDGSFQDAVATQPSFAVQVIGAGDFNGDGKADLATAGSFGASSGVNILLGNGDGTFTVGASYPGTEVEPQSIAVADFNHDHKLDFAVAALFGGITVFLGNGDGTFVQEPELGVSGPVSMAAADLNGDGNVDLVTANDEFIGQHQLGGATVLMGKGDGTFRSATSYRCDSLASSVAVGDFNGDKKPDLVIANYGGTSVSVLLNTGVVSFSPTTPLNFKSQAVGTTSPPQTVKLTNAGATALRISSMKTSTEFAVTSSCGKTVAAGANCTISATFSPTKKGGAQGTITIIDSASTKPQVIELLGTGT